MKTILVVDDDERISAAVAIRLRAAGYQAVTASDGVKGLELAIEHQVSLIITDIWMTVGNGFSLAHRLRSALPRVPVLFMTASKRPGLREMAAQTGAAGFFEKPFDMQAMMSAVEICVGPGETGEPDSPEGTEEPELIDPSMSPELQADSPGSLDRNPPEPAVPPLAELVSVESAPPPRTESSAVETPPPLPPSVVSRPAPEPLVALPDSPAESTCPPSPDASPIDPAPRPLAESTDNFPVPTGLPIEESEPQVSDSSTSHEFSWESPVPLNSLRSSDTPLPPLEPPAGLNRTLPSAELVGARRILVADTDEQAATHLADRFRELGHEVWVANDPAGAVEHVIACQPELAVIDLAMPGSTGFTVARQVQTLASDPVAIIFTTSKKRVEYRKLATQFGAVGLFEKPYPTQDLLHAAFAVLEKSMPVAS